MTDQIVKPQKYDKDQIDKLITDSGLEWEGVNKDTLIKFIEVLPADSINLGQDNKIESFGKDSNGKTKPISEFLSSLKRVLKSQGISDFSVEVDDKNLDPALKNFINVDLSKYVKDGDHLIVGSDFSDKLISYMQNNQSSLSADKNFKPGLFGSVMATFVSELPDNIKTIEQKKELIEKMVPFASGAIAKLSTKFANDAGTHKMVLSADEDQKAVVLQTLRECMKEVNKSQTKDSKTLELAGKEYMRGSNSLLNKVKRIFIGDKSNRAEIYGAYKAKQRETQKNQAR